MSIVTRDYQGHAIAYQDDGFRQFLYVCLFDNGHIKVGRTCRPDRRINQHAKRLACVGIGLTSHFVAGCKGSIAQAESVLIQKCCESASKQHLNEWFVGLDYSMVCKWCEDSASDAVAAIEGQVAAPNGALADNFEASFYRMNGLRKPTETTDIRGKVYSEDPVSDAVEFVLFGQDADADSDWEEDAFYARFDELPINVTEMLPALTDFNNGLIFCRLTYEQRKPIVKQYAMDWRMSHAALPSAA